MGSFFQHVLSTPPQEVRALHRTVCLNLLAAGQPRDFIYVPMHRPYASDIPILVRSANPRPGWRYERVGNDERYDFLVTCHILVHDQKTRRRYSPKLRERRMSWFEQQARQGGFSLLDAYEEQHRQHLQLAIRPGVTERIYATTFTGRLQVTDEGPFTHELTTGFGKSMTYGLGMMLLKPVLRH